MQIIANITVIILAAVITSSLIGVVIAIYYINKKILGFKDNEPQEQI